MTPNRTNIDLVFRSLSAEYNNAYELAEPMWPEIAMDVRSNTAIQEYPWLTMFPSMREWIGERAVKQLAAHNYTLRNKDWETTIAIDSNHFRDDQLGMYATQARGAGTSARIWPDERVFHAVNRGFAEVCHDGRPFFDKNHPLDDAPGFPNLLDAPLQADSLENARASFGEAEVMLMEMADPNGRPLGLMPKCLLVPPALKATANLLMTSDRLGGLDPNPYKGAAKVLASPRLTSKTAWFLTAEGGGGLKPFIWQLRQAAELAMLMDPDNPHVFSLREFLFGVHGRGEAGYTLPQLVVASTGTG